MAAPAPKRRRIQYEKVTVAWICATLEELLTARSMLDNEYSLYVQKSGDPNNYVVGRIGRHVVVIACVDCHIDPSSATSAAIQLVRSFPMVTCGLMVGTAGGVTCWKEYDVRLGDVVVSYPQETSGGVVAFEVGKAVDGGTTIRGQFNRAPDALRNAANMTATDRRLKAYKDRMAVIMEKASMNLADATGAWPPPNEDLDLLRCSKAEHDNNHDPSSCPLNCHPENKMAQRPLRPDRVPRVHHGLVASSHKVISDECQRDTVVEELHAKFGFKLLCFEMEAFSLVNKLPCLVVRGISDYADSEKADGWKLYAALSAAAYAKELLQSLLPDEAKEEKSLLEQSEILSECDPGDGMYRDAIKKYLDDRSDLYPQPVEFSAESTSKSPPESRQVIVSRLDQYELETRTPRPEVSTPLHFAAARGDIEAVRVLRKLGKDVGDTDSRGWGLMHHAAASGQLAMIVYLFKEFNQDPGPINFNGATPLHLAASKGRIAVVDLLRRLGQDLSVTDDDGSTCLHYATRNGQVAMVDHLLQQSGHLVRDNDKRGWSSMHHAAVSGETEMVDHLYQQWGLDLNIKTNQGESLMHVAAIGGRLEMIDHLHLRWKQDLGIENDSGDTPIHLAAAYGQVEMIDHLHQRWRQDLSIKNVRGNTVMHIAAASGQVEMIDHLHLRWTQDLGIKNTRGETPMHVAAAFGQITVARYLLQHGQDAGAKNAEGSTPLFYAAANDNIEVFDYLWREHGQDIWAENDLGQCSLDKAFIDGKGIMARHLLQLQGEAEDTASG